MTLLYARRPWVDQAVCAQVDAEIFFPDPGDQATAALAICAQCPVQTECLNDALTSGDLYFGIRGGKTPSQRQRLAARPCVWCGDPLDADSYGQRRYHPDCHIEYRTIQKREYNQNYDRRRTAA